MALREILLHLLVIAICFCSLFRPRIGLYGYLWYSLMRPDAWAWAEGHYSESAVIAIFTTIGVFRFVPDIKAWITNPWVISMFLLQIPIIGSIAVAPMQDPAVAAYIRLLKLLVVTILIPLMIQTKEDFRQMILVIGISIGMVGFKFGIFSLRYGSGFEFGLGGFIGDNNTLALALLIGLPFLWFGAKAVNQLWLKGWMYFCAFLSVVTIIFSHSRGAALTLVALLLLTAFRSRHKVLTLALLVLCTLPAMYFVGDTYAKRMSTLTALESNDDGSMEGSMRERISYAKAAIQVWKDHPAFGVGYGTDNWAAISLRYLTSNNQKHVVHNNYLQWAVDCGTFGFLIVVFQIWGSIWYLRRSYKRVKRTYPGYEIYPAAAELAMIAFGIGSAFLSRTDYDLYYYLVMVSGAWFIVEHNNLPLLLMKAAPKAVPVESAAPDASRITNAIPSRKPAPVRVTSSAPRVARTAMSPLRPHS